MTREYPPPVPLVYSVEILTMAHGDADAAAYLARMTDETRRRFDTWCRGKGTR